MDRDIVVSGVHIGEHSFEPENIIEEIKKRCIAHGMNFVTIRTRRELVDSSYFLKWAKFLADNKIYFIFLYTVQHAPEGRKSQFDAETVAKIKEIAGEFFLGDMIGETGSRFACKLPGYFFEGGDTLPPQNVPDTYTAKENYVKEVKKLIDIDKELGMPNTLTVEATSLNKYNIEAGIDIPMLELMCGHPEILIASLRGLARACSSPIWGTYVAHEWYGGMRHDDVLKQKRLSLAYNYAYLSGSNVFCLESGDERIESYGYDYGEDHEYCKQYRDVISEFAGFIKEDERPKGGPKVSVAFVQGNLDAWGGWGGSSLWGQFGGKQWGHSSPEYSWNMLNELGEKRSWCDIANYGDNDLSFAPAYGQYDIIPAESDAEKMKKYDYLIFLGYNVMTEKMADNLIEYVNEGGKLIISGAHLNTNPQRDGKIKLIDKDRQRKLFGCVMDEEGFVTNYGVKFKKTSLTDTLMYPGTDDFICDPIYSAGYTTYANTAVFEGTVAAELTDGFLPQRSTPKGAAVVENRLGKGTSVLVTSLDYPGHGAVYPLYRAIVRETVTASHRHCPIKIYGSDKIRFSVYEGNKIYLLNTDYDASSEVIIEYNGKKQKIKLESCEFKTIYV